MLHMNATMLHADRGGIVVGWLLKLTLVLVAVGLIAYDGIAIAYNKVSVSDDASYIARGASEAIILERASDEEAVEVARQRAVERGVTLGKKDVVITSDGSIQVHVRRVPDTLIVKRIGPLQPYVVADETYSTPALQ